MIDIIATPILKQKNLKFWLDLLWVSKYEQVEPLNGEIYKTRVWGIASVNINWSLQQDSYKFVCIS